VELLALADEIEFAGVLVTHHHAGHVVGDLRLFSLAKVTLTVLLLSVPDPGRKLMRYIKRYNDDPRPIKWSYVDVTNRMIGTSSLNTGHWSVGWSVPGGRRLENARTGNGRPSAVRYFSVNACNDDESRT